MAPVMKSYSYIFSDKIHHSENSSSLLILHYKFRDIHKQNKDNEFYESFDKGII